MTSSPTSSGKKVKAWAILRGGNLRHQFAFGPMDIYQNKAEAAKALRNEFMHLTNGYRLIPCTITYSVPNN